MGRVAQVEVGVEVDDAQARRLAGVVQVGGEAQPAAVGQLVAAAEDDRPVAGGQQCGDPRAELALRRVEVAVGAGHVAGVEDRAAAVPGQVGQRAADRLRPGGGADAAVVAAHALVAGEAEQGHAGRAGGGQRLDALVPAQGVRPGIDPAAPRRHVRALSGHG
ncbi:hypothetical protein D3C81_1386530 [compost metagenome]